MLIHYKEDIKAANSCRQAYLDSVERLVQRKLSECADFRMNGATGILSDPENARRALCELIGWPLTETVKPPLSVERQLLREENDTRLYRMKFEVFEDFFFYGLFLEHMDQKLPFVLTQHGYGGTSEQCADLFEVSSAIYNSMSQRVAAKNVHVFVPQLLMWFPERYDMEHQRVLLDAKLKQLGGSITALEIYCLRCCISYFEALDCVDAANMGMVGLSYGGYFTLYTMALDTRLKAGLCCCYFGDRTGFTFPDWTWKNSAKQFLDSEVALLCYPRRLWLALGQRDEAATPESATAELRRLKQALTLAGVDDSWLRFVIFDGAHEFCPDDTILDEMIETLN